MDTEPQVPTFDESVSLVTRGLPTVVRAYLADEKHTQVSESLALKYRLRTEQAKILSESIVLLITGVYGQSDFTEELLEQAKVDQKTSEALYAEITTRIFTPLNDQVALQAKLAAVAPAPAIKPPTVSAVAPKVPLPSYSAPPLQSPRYVRPEAAVPNPTLAPLPPKMAMPRPHVTLGAVGPAPVTQRTAPAAEKPAPQPVVRPAMLAPQAALPEVEHLVELPVGEKPETAPMPPATPVAQAPVVPAAAPAAVAPEMVTVAPPAPKPAPVVPTPAPAPARASDPYREPIDEKDH